MNLQTATRIALCMAAIGLISKIAAYFSGNHFLIYWAADFGGSGGLVVFLSAVALKQKE